MMTIEKRVSEENSFDVTNLAGDEGFEPPNGGTRTHCLTTWRIPIGSYYVSIDFGKIPVLGKLPILLCNLFEPIFGLRIFEKRWLMRKLPIQDAKNMTTVDLIECLRNRDFSLLESAGCHRLRREMYVPGFLCRFTVNTAFRLSGAGKRKTTHTYRKVRRKLCKLLDKVTPAEVNGNFPQAHDRAFVFGFNHPSLGEIGRFVGVCMRDYGQRKHLFPVNLPWYEALMPIVGKLEELGIYITPIITPSAYEKIKAYASDEWLEQLDMTRTGFSSHYMKLCTKFAEEGGIIWVAPSATRRRTVFNSTDECSMKVACAPQTMSLLATALAKAKITDCDFVPLGIQPPTGFKPGLNLFKTYRISVGKVIPMSEASDLLKQRLPSGRGRRLDHEFLSRIAKQVAILGSSDIIYPAS